MKFYCHDICTAVQYVVTRMQVAFVLPHGEASISASGLHVVREARAGGLPLPFLDLDSFGPRVCLDAEGVRVTDVINYRNKIPAYR